MWGATISRRGFCLGSVAAAGLTVAGCAAGPAEKQGAAPGNSSSPDEESLVAISTQRIDSAVEALDGLVHGLLSRTGLPGMAVAVVHNDKVVYAKGFGVRKVGTSARVDADTIFYLASVSKAVASTVVARLVGQKVVAWDDPVTRYLPAFALSDPYVTQHVTIADMFSHRSGLPDHAGDLMEDLGYDRAAILERLRHYPLASFRDTYAYTNFGLTAGAVAAATARGIAWEDLSQQELYGPLGMSSTSSRYADYARASNRAVLHVRENGRWLPKYQRNPDPQSPAGGVTSSVNDMARWMRLQLAAGKLNGEQVVDYAALLTTHTPHIVLRPPSSPSDRPSFYGLGTNIAVDEAGRMRFSHSGAFNQGAATTFLLLPSASLGIVVLTNGMPIGVPEALANSFADVVEAGEIQQDWLDFIYPRAFAPLYENPSRLAGKQAPANPAPALDDAAYVGTYANDLYGPARFEATSGGLVLELGPGPTRFPLTHWDGSTFSYMPTGENALGIAAVTFTVGATGQASSVSIENFNGETSGTANLGTFDRA